MHSRSVAAHPRKCVVSAARREAKSRSASKLSGSSVTCIWTPPCAVFAFFDFFMAGALASRFFRPCGRSRRLGMSGRRDGCELGPAPAVITSTSPLGGAGPSSCSSCRSPLVRSAAARALCALIRSSMFAAACRRCSSEKIGASKGTYREVGFCLFCIGATRATGAALPPRVVMSITIYQCRRLLLPLMNARASNS